jgi:3-oxoacyl-[acyl-carrier protein] reductase
MTNRLQNKVALVTGGSRGIGAGIVQAFLAEGATVAFSGTGATTLASAAQTFGAGSHHGFLSDLSKPEAASQLVAAVLQKFKRIDILVNNAGVVSRTDEWTLSPDEWDRVHDVNLRATFFVARDCAIAMKANGGGSILNVSSIAGQHGGIAGSPAYASSKAAVIGLTRSLSRRFAPYAIRVNCIAPADIETDMTANWPQELRDRLNSLTPLGRFGSVREVAGAAVFLVSDDASYITGQTLAINGGAFMG